MMAIRYEKGLETAGIQERLGKGKNTGLQLYIVIHPQTPVSFTQNFTVCE